MSNTRYTHEDSERTLVENYLRFNDRGASVWRDENMRCIVRTSTGVNTLPDCNLYEDWNEESKSGKLVGEHVLIWDAVDFLFDDGEEQS